MSFLPRLTRAGLSVPAALSSIFKTRGLRLLSLSARSDDFAFFIIEIRYQDLDNPVSFSSVDRKVREHLSRMPADFLLLDFGDFRNQSFFERLKILGMFLRDLFNHVRGAHPYNRIGIEHPFKNLIKKLRLP